MRAIFRFQTSRIRLFSAFKAPISRNSRSELNYKEENGVSSPYDVIDRNPSGIQKRLQLLEMRRLKEQLILDAPELDALKEQNLKSFNSSFQKDKIAYTIEYIAISNSPGLSNAANSSTTDSTVNLYIPPDTFKASDLNSIDKLLPLDEKYECYKLSVSDFPFVSQNRKRAIELFDSLKLSVPDPDSFKATTSDLSSTTSISDINMRVKDRCEKKKRTLKFPLEWLQNQKEQN